MSTIELITAAIEAELNGSMDSWSERWTFPGGMYDDAPPPPGKFALFNVERLAIAIAEALEAKPK